MYKKLNYVAEIAGVILIGAGVVFCGLNLFGHGLISSIGSVWIANVLMLLAIHGSLKLRGQAWEHLGLEMGIFEPRAFVRVFLLSIPVFVIATLAFAVGAILMANIFGMPEPADMSKYDYLQGNIGRTLLALASVYFVSSFAEEVIYRGFMITRMIELGEGKKLAYVFALTVSSLVFGLVHSDWGVPGMVQATLMGMALGMMFLVVRRNLWVTILAHAYMDTILILQMYFVGQ